MKRIYLLFALLIAFSANTFAQRSIDLEVTLVSPTSSTVIEAGKSFNVRAVVKNLGPDSLKMTDSTLWFVTLSGQPLPFSIGGQQGTYWQRYNRTLQTGDTFHLNFDNRVLNYTQNVDSNRTMCFNVLPNFDGGGNDTISDPQLTNNSSCVTMMFKASFAASVEEALVTEAGSNKAVLYPNPASNKANIAVNMSYNADVSIRVMDLTGRVVLETTHENVTSGTHKFDLDINHLTTGLYIYNVKMGDHTSSGKFTVAK